MRDVLRYCWEAIEELRTDLQRHHVERRGRLRCAGEDATECIPQEIALIVKRLKIVTEPSCSYQVLDAVGSCESGTPGSNQTHTHKR